MKTSRSIRVYFLNIKKMERHGHNASLVWETLHTVRQQWSVHHVCRTTLVHRMRQTVQHPRAYRDKSLAAVSAMQLATGDLAIALVTSLALSLFLLSSNQAPDWRFQFSGPCKLVESLEIEAPFLDGKGSGTLNGWWKMSWLFKEKSEHT